MKLSTQFRGLTLSQSTSNASVMQLKAPVRTVVVSRTSRLRCNAVAYEQETLQTTQMSVQSETNTELTDKELVRRAKISMANKGKRPWNKGRSLSDEVRAKISRNTFLAMQRPDVRARMHEANMHRKAHSAEVRLKIKTALVTHAAKCKQTLAEQIDLIIPKLEASTSHDDQRLLSSPHREVILMKAAWAIYKRYDDMALSASKWDTDERFRSLAYKKTEAAYAQQEKKEESRLKSARKQASRGKVQAALRTAKSLARAKTKLQEAEIAVAKLQRLKQQLRGDPQKFAAAESAEQQTKQVMATLRAQVAKLTETLAPLSQYLSIEMEKGDSDVESAAEAHNMA